MPPRIRKLRVHDGYPVPSFVQWFKTPEGPKPDFRVLKQGWIFRCVDEQLCWICGQRLVEERVAFVIGPMCMCNRVSAEPPCHEACARYAATACPFLNTPRRKRNPKGLIGDLEPFGATTQPGHDPRNPGCCVVWTVKRTGAAVWDQSLFHIAEPLKVELYASGRRATIDESREALEAGLEIIRAEAAQEGPEAFAAFTEEAARARELVEDAHGGAKRGAGSANNNEAGGGNPKCPISFRAQG